MKYLKLNEDGSIDYPYSIETLKEENPNTSFTEVISVQLLNSYLIYKVNELSYSNDYTKNYNELTPVLINNGYYQEWEVIEATQEEIEERVNSQWDQIRFIRNQYLAETDWTQLSDSPLIGETKENWIQYRQSLRDITDQEDPFNIIWPTKPE